MSNEQKGPLQTFLDFLRILKGVPPESKPKNVKVKKGKK